MFCKEYWSSEEIALNILQSDMNLPQPDLLPPVITPKGISRDRAEYLYKEIREFCRAGTEDLVAPEVKWTFYSYRNFMGTQVLAISISISMF